MNLITWVILFLVCPPLAFIVFFGKILKKLVKPLLCVYMIFYFLLIVHLFF
jgi:hypothetical protein